MLTALWVVVLVIALAALLAWVRRLRTEVAWLTDEVAANLSRVDQLAARVCAAEACVRGLWDAVAPPDLPPPTSVPAPVVLLSDTISPC